MDIEQLLVEIRINLQADGADIRLLENNAPEKLKLKLLGKSKGAELIGVPLKETIVKYIQGVFPEIQTIEIL